MLAYPQDNSWRSEGPLHPQTLEPLEGPLHPFTRVKPMKALDYTYAVLFAIELILKICVHGWSFFYIQDRSLRGPQIRPQPPSLPRLPGLGCEPLAQNPAKRRLVRESPSQN